MTDAGNDAGDPFGRSEASAHDCGAVPNQPPLGRIEGDASGKRARRRRRRKPSQADESGLGRAAGLKDAPFAAYSAERASSSSDATAPLQGPSNGKGVGGGRAANKRNPNKGMGRRQSPTSNQDAAGPQSTGGFAPQLVPAHGHDLPRKPSQAGVQRHAAAAKPTQGAIRGLRSPIHGRVPRASVVQERGNEWGITSASADDGLHRALSRGRPIRAVPVSGFVPTPEPDWSYSRDVPLYAALDLGTNNCRLLIVEPRETGFRVVDAFSRIVRLGEGIGRTGRLSDDAMNRAVEALAICRMKMDQHQVRRARLIATEACRAASNGAEFIARVARETGLSLEIVNRETEARLAVAGCATLVDTSSKGAVIFDIGGGSSELVWLDLRGKTNRQSEHMTGHIAAWTSLPVGVVTLSERHGGVDVTPPLFAKMVDEVTEMLNAFSPGQELDRLVASGDVHLLGTSGTVTTLAGVHLGLKRYDRRRVDGVWLYADDVDHMLHRMSEMSYEQRVANPCIGTDRADLVLAGCAILDAIRRRWPCQRLRVADRGLREGILTELIARDFSA